MAARVTLLTGPARCGKTERLLARYREELARGSPGATLWLAPTQRSAFDIRGRLLTAGLPACVSPGVMTFAQLAEAVLAASGSVLRRISLWQQRKLVRWIIGRQHAEGKLVHFAPIAETQGLIDLVGQFVRELKRLEVWPDDFRAACQKLGLSSKDRELAGLYDDYQETLTRHNLYDAEGSFWSTRALLQQGQTGPFAGLRVIVADGFTDFTRTQHEILQLLAGRAEEMFVTLPLEPAPCRRELFAKSLETRDRLRERHLALTEEELPRPATPPWAALDHIERHLFGNPRASHTASDTSGIEIIAAARQIGEVEMVARRIKDLLTQGDPAGGGPVVPGQIAVVARSLTEYGPLIREVFEEYGLPTAVEAGLRLQDSPALSALVQFVRLVEDDWPFRQLLAVVNHNFFRPAWPEARFHERMATERVIRELQVPEGQAALCDHIRRWARLDGAAAAAPPPTDPQEQEELVHRRQRAQTALALLGRLHQILTALPEQATADEWWSALENLATETALMDFVRSQHGSTLRPAAHDRAAWSRLGEDLAALDELHRWMGQASPKLSRRQILALLEELAATEQLPSGHDETGRVRVLAAASARALAIPYLFIIGLNEKSFPPPERDDLLYSEGDVRRLREHNVPLRLRAERASDEMLLFYEVLTRAARHVCLSYTALDAKGLDLLPSPYLVEVDRACGPERIRWTRDLHLNPRPRTSEPCSPSEFRLLAVDQALHGEDDLLAGLVIRPETRSVGENVLAGLYMTGERSRWEGFGPFEGLLPGDAARAELARRYGGDHCFSASHLEQYANCPYQFFLQHVLRLKPLEELGLETDYGQRGSVLHDVLAGLHRRWKAARDTNGDHGPLDLSELERHLADALELLATYADDPSTLASALRAIDRRLVERWTRPYRQQLESYDEKWVACDERPLPAHFEVSFGRDDLSDDPLSTAAPLVLDVPGQQVKISGRIDRIDLGRAADRDVFNVLDYKSGKSAGYKPDVPVDGTRLQLELYTIAAEELLLASRNALPLANGYWWIKEKGYKLWRQCHEPGASGLTPTPDWEERQQQVRQRVLELVEGIRRAEFPVSSRDPHCTGHCPYSTVCRINQVRSLEKSWP